MAAALIGRAPLTPEESDESDDSDDDVLGDTSTSASMLINPLSTGAIERAMNNDTQPCVVQCVYLKHIRHMNASRYRLLISDGRSVMTAMLATGANDVVEQEQVRNPPLHPPASPPFFSIAALILHAPFCASCLQLREWSVMRINEFTCNMVQGHKIAIVLNAQVIDHVDYCIETNGRVRNKGGGG